MRGAAYWLHVLAAWNAHQARCPSGFMHGATASIRGLQAAICRTLR